MAVQSASDSCEALTVMTSVAMLSHEKQCSTCMHRPTDDESWCYSILRRWYIICSTYTVLLLPAGEAKSHWGGNCGTLVGIKYHWSCPPGMDIHVQVPGFRVHLCNSYNVTILNKSFENRINISPNR
jgi:hypothetical protein